jgi:hypothetical protein
MPKAPHAKAPAVLTFVSHPTSRSPNQAELGIINSLHIDPPPGNIIGNINDAMHVRPNFIENAIGNIIENVRPKNPPPPPPKAGGLLGRGEIPRMVRFGEASVAPPMEIINSVGPNGEEARSILQARMVHRQGYPAMRGPGNAHRGNIGPIDGLPGGPDIADPNHPAPVHRDAPTAVQGEDAIMTDLQRCLQGVNVAEQPSSVGGVHRHIPGAVSSDSIREQELRQDRRRTRHQVRIEAERTRRQVQIEAQLDASLEEAFGAMDTSSDEGEVLRTRAGGPGQPWVPAQPKASTPGRGRRGMEDP